jgi:hypothetical protein
MWAKAEILVLNLEVDFRLLKHKEMSTQVERKEGRIR